MRTPKKVDVIGLDLSLRRAAAVCLPYDWTPGDWDFPVTTCGYEPVVNNHLTAALRLVETTERIWRFVVDCARPGSIGLVYPRVFVEDYAYGLAMRGGVKLAELGGAIKAMLGSRGVYVEPVNIATARKLLLGKVPRKGAKDAVHGMLRQAGATWEGTDESDAFAVANAGRSRLDMVAMAIGE